MLPSPVTIQYHVTADVLITLWFFEWCHQSLYHAMSTLLFKMSRQNLTPGRLLTRNWPQVMWLESPVSWPVQPWRSLPISDNWPIKGHQSSCDSFLSTTSQHLMVILNIFTSAKKFLNKLQVGGGFSFISWSIYGKDHENLQR